MNEMTKEKNAIKDELDELMGMFGDDDLSEGLSVTERAYFDRPGDIVVEMVEYDFFDGRFDPNTKRNRKKILGPVFNFRVLAVDSGEYKEGERLGKIINVKNASVDAEKYRFSEINGIFAALAKTMGEDYSGTKANLAEWLRDVDGTMARLKGARAKARCFEARNKEGEIKTDKEGKPYINVTFQAV